MKKVLTIAGSDCSGGAGIQADIKTIMAHKMYAMSVITSLTAQNTTGVYGILDADGEFVGKQIDCVMTDIFPDAIKIGMVSKVDIIDMISKKIDEYKPNNVVVDPVMVSTSGSKLLSDDAMNILINELIPKATIITPNIKEAVCLSGIDIKNKEDMVSSAKKIFENYKGAILIKGGHLEQTADDLLYLDGKEYWFLSERIDNNNTHGTGCTLSSAIACNLANGLSIVDSVKNAKEYVKNALKLNLNLGKGNGPLNHIV